MSLISGVCNARSFQFNCLSFGTSSDTEAFYILSSDSEQRLSDK